LLRATRPRVVGVMKRVLFLAALLLAGGARAESPRDPDNTGMEQSADLLLIGLPVVALGLTFLLPEESKGAPSSSLLGYDFVHMTGTPRHDLSLALLRTTSVTYGLKYAVDEERPNGKDGSFPSAHTAITFAGAEFIRKEYGWAFGAPAFAAASFVGWSRVETRDHWWHDVAAGAAIGILSNHDLSEMSSRWGTLSLKPALLEASRDAGYLRKVPETAPGLTVELRF
jgi:membrane-associated phospholipid phosphatase